jgi:hypothetical protein
MLTRPELKPREPFRIRMLETASILLCLVMCGLIGSMVTMFVLNERKPPEPERGRVMRAVDPVGECRAKVTIDGVFIGTVPTSCDERGVGVYTIEGHRPW